MTVFWKSHLYDILFWVKIFVEISFQILSRYPHHFLPCLEPASCVEGGCWCVQWQEQPGGGDLQETTAHPPGAQMRLCCRQESLGTAQRLVITHTCKIVFFYLVQSGGGLDTQRALVRHAWYYKNVYMQGPPKFHLRIISMWHVPPNGNLMARNIGTWHSMQWSILNT